MHETCSVVWHNGAAERFSSTLDAIAAGQGVLSDHPSAIVAIATGEVRTGDPSGQSAIDSEARRLATQAAPGELVVSPAARLLAETQHSFVQRFVNGPITLVLEQHHPFAADDEDGPMIDRPAARQVLDRAWRDVRDGQAVSILVEGEAGAGKTRLLQRMSRQALADGAHVLAGGCSNAVDVAYAPVAQALRRALEAGYLEPYVAQLDAGIRADLAEIVPPLGIDAASAPGSVPVGRPLLDEESRRFWGFEAVASLLASMSETRPVLITIDDLHWADQRTLELIDHLANRSDMTRMALLLSARDSSADHSSAYAGARERLLSSSRLEQLELSPLEFERVRKYVAGHVGSEQLPETLEVVSHWLHQSSGGNVLLLVESWKHLVESGCVEQTKNGWSVHDLPTGEGAPSIASFTQRRLATLDPDASRLLETAACSGTMFDVRQIATASNSSIAVALELLARGAQAGLIERSSPASFQFRHALVQQAIVDGLSIGDRPARHLALAESLENLAIDEPARIAHHWVRAVPLVPPDRAVEWAAVAATRATESLSFDNTLGVLHEVLDVVETRAQRAAVLTDLARTEARAGNSPAAAAACLEAIDLARRAHDKEQLVLAAEALAEATWLGTLDGRPAVEVLVEVLKFDHPPERRSRLLSRLAAARAFTGDNQGSMEAGVQARRIAADIGHPHLELEAIHSLLYVAMNPDNVHDQLRRAQEGIDIAQKNGERYAEMQLITKQVLRAFVIPGPAALRPTIDQLIHLANELRQPYYMVVRTGAEVALALAEGRFDDAEERVAEYSTWAERSAQPDSGIGIQMFSIRREQGRLQELLPILEMGAKFSPETAWIPGLAALYAEVGLTDRAAGILDEFDLESLSTLAADSMLPGTLSYLTDATYATRHTEAASVLLPLLQPWSGLMIYVPGLVCYGAADRYIGMLHAVLGDEGNALQHLRHAIDLDEAMGWHPWAARSHLSMAETLLAKRRPDPQHASAHIDQAVEIGRALGMSALVQRAEEVERVAIELDLAIATQGTSLTPREREVIALVAEGLSNRQIGDSLHASQHTIANHVRSILRKTETRNRTEAARWAHRHRLIS